MSNQKRAIVAKLVEPSGHVGGLILAIPANACPLKVLPLIVAGALRVDPGGR